MKIERVETYMVSQKLETPFSYSENPLRDELTIPHLNVDSGYVDVPTAPGLGVDVDHENLKRFQATM